MFGETKTRDMTVGSPLKHIVAFAVPMIIGNLLQQLYGVLDTAIVGRGVSTQALAAVGAAVSLSMLVIKIVNGFTNGFALAVAKYFGSKDEGRAGDRGCIPVSRDLRLHGLEPWASAALPLRTGSARQYGHPDVLGDHRAGAPAHCRVHSAGKLGLLPHLLCGGRRMAFRDADAFCRLPCKAQ